MKTVLVIGGAGYIGANMCKHLSRSGYQPVVIDNLIYGHRQAVRWGSFYEGCLSDDALLEHVFSSHDIQAVMHFAAFCYVGESVSDPGKYYLNNVAHTVKLLNFMVLKNVRRFIFSSSCATYGEPIQIPISETHPQQPINPYGRTKLMVEQILSDFDRAHGMTSVSLRYFNAAGADPEGELGEDHRPETHLIPLVLQTASGQRDHIDVFGNDYPTRDGTCIRDYIHIADLAQAHLLALERLLDGKPGAAYNLGNGEGYSVLEVIEAAQRITKLPVAVRITGRRSGDPAILIGSSHKAVQELGWRQQYSDLGSVIGTAWNWHKQNPDGYRY